MTAPRWRDVLGILRWHLQMRIHQVNRATNAERPNSASVYLELLQQSYDASRFLRTYLGYYKKTKLELEAERLLGIKQAEH